MRVLVLVILGVIAAVYLLPGILSALIHGAVGLFVSAGVVALLGGLAFLLGFVIFGSAVIATLAAVAAVAVFGLGLFWPILLLVGVIWLLTRKRPQAV